MSSLEEIVDFPVDADARWRVFARILYLDLESWIRKAVLAIEEYFPGRRCWLAPYESHYSGEPEGIELVIPLIGEGQTEEEIFSTFIHEWIIHNMYDVLGNIRISTEYT